jgi:hypothetical protein
MEQLWAEEFAHPSYKWIEQRQYLNNLQGWRISAFPGGIGFSLHNCSPEKGIRVEFCTEREDGTTETYLCDAYYCGEWGGGWQKWQADSLPLFPYESLHGCIRSMRFRYNLVKDGTAIPSRYAYRFAILDDFHRGHVSLDHFKPMQIQEGIRRSGIPGRQTVQAAYDAMNAENGANSIMPLFTRGNVGGEAHPLRALHRAIDRVITRKEADPPGDHYI